MNEETSPAGFYGAVANYLRKRGCPVKQVTSVEQLKETRGFCPTCIYEDIVVYITYVDSTDKVERYTYEGGMVNFIDQLFQE